MIVKLPEHINFNSSSYFIYELLDPISLEQKYIGCTNNIYRRYTNHMSPNKLKQNTKKIRWIVDLKNKNLKPILRVLAITTKDHIFKAEIDFIAKNPNLLNETGGGPGASNLSDLVRQKISNTNTGKKRGPLSLEIKEKIRQGNLGINKPVSFTAYLNRTKQILVKDLNSNIETTYFSAKKFAETIGCDKCTIYRKIGKTYKNYSIEWSK